MFNERLAYRNACLTSQGTPCYLKLDHAQSRVRETAPYHGEDFVRVIRKLSILDGVNKNERPSVVGETYQSPSAREIHSIFGARCSHDGWRRTRRTGDFNTMRIRVGIVAPGKVDT